MKKKYLAYVLSAAMLTSMMPATSVYADVTGGKGSLTYAAEKAATASPDVTIQAGTAMPNQVKYSSDNSSDSAEYKFSVAVAKDAVGNSMNVTVKVYKANTNGNGKTGDVLAFSQPAALAANGATGKKADDVVVDVKGLDVGKYIAYAETDDANEPKESQTGLAFEIKKADAPLLSWDGSFAPNKTEIPYTGDAVVLEGADNAVNSNPTGVETAFKYYKDFQGHEYLTDMNPNGDGAAEEGQAPKNVGTYKVQGVTNDSNYEDAATSNKKSFTIGQVAPTSIKIAETGAASANEVDLVENANPEIILAKDTTDLSKITATVTGVKDEKGEKVGALKWTTDGSADIVGDLTAQEITNGKTGLKLYWEFVPTTTNPQNYKALATNKGTVTFKVAQEPVVDKIASVDLTEMPAPSLEKKVADSKTITAEIPDIITKTVEWHKTAKNTAIKASELGDVYEGSTVDATKGKFEANNNDQYVAKVTLKTDAKTFEAVDTLKNNIILPQGAALSTDASAVALDPSSKTLTLVVVFPELKAAATEVTNVTVKGWANPTVDTAILNFNKDITVKAKDLAGQTFATKVEYKKFTTADAPKTTSDWDAKGGEAIGNFESTTTHKYVAKVTVTNNTADGKNFAATPIVTIGDGTTQVKDAKGAQKVLTFLVDVDVQAAEQEIEPGQAQTPNTNTEPVKNTVKGTGLPADGKNIAVSAKTANGKAYDKAEVTVKADALKALGEQTNTNVGLVIDADAATVTLPKEALKAIKAVDTDGTKGAVITIENDKTAAAADLTKAVKVDVSVDGKPIDTFGTSVTVTLELDSANKDFIYLIEKAGDVVKVLEKLTAVKHQAGPVMLAAPVAAPVAASSKFDVKMAKPGEIGVFTKVQEVAPAPTEKVKLKGTATVDAVTYNGKTTLRDLEAKITGEVKTVDKQEVVAGTWVWDKSDAFTKDALGKVLTVADPAPIYYKAKFLPTADANKYEDLVADVTVTVNAAKPTVRAITTEVQKAAKNTMKGSEIKALLKAYGVDGKELTGGTWEIKKDATSVQDTDTPFKDVVGANQELKVVYTPAGADKNYMKSDEAAITFNFTETKPRQLSFAQNTVNVVYGNIVKNDLTDNAKDEADETKAPKVKYTVEAASGGDASAIATIDPATGDVTIKGVGKVTVKATAEKGTSSVATNNYGAAEASYTLEIAKADATVTVKANPDKVKVGATTKPTYSYEVTGLVNNETADKAITGAATYKIVNGKTFAEVVKVAGSYQVTVEGLSANNYNLNIAPATVTVEDNGGVTPQPPTPPTPPSNGGGSSHGHGGSSHGHGGSVAKPDVYVDSTGSSKNGKVEISNKNAKPGDKVTVTVKPDKGYELDKIVIKDRNGNKIDVKEEKDGEFSFIMPKSGKVDIEPIFTKVEEKEEDKDKEETKKDPIEMNTITSKTFNDVHGNDWFKTAVDYVVSNGIMAGVGDREFAPNQNMTRAMVWQVLAKIDGANTAGGAKWYSKAMEWGMSRKITDGSNVNGKVTREQLASMLYRYAKDKGMTVSTKDSLAKFPDAQKVSGYASEAMQWAVGAGLINGMDGKLNPQGNATRAQVATILMNFDKLVK